MNVYVLDFVVVVGLTCELTGGHATLASLVSLHVKAYPASRKKRTRVRVDYNSFAHLYLTDNYNGRSIKKTRYRTSIYHKDARPKGATSCFSRFMAG
jgi:hypothetical protein